MQEKIENRAWKIQIRELQQNILYLGFDPSISKPVKGILKERDNEIQNLKKKMKIPSTQHIEYLEFIALQEERDKHHKEVLVYKEQVSQHKDDIMALAKEKAWLLVFKASISKQDPSTTSKSISKAMSKLKQRVREISKH